MKNKKKTNNKTNKNGFKNIGIINSEYSIYTYKTKSIDGKRVDKRTCQYYNKNTNKCTNAKCSVIYCIGAGKCTCYKRKAKIKTELSPYDDLYIQLPTQSGIHESSNEYITVSRNIGTPCHVGYLKSNDKRRHKTRCIYYDKIKKLCKYFMYKCKGSSRCEKYKEIE